MTKTFRKGLSLLMAILMVVNLIGVPVFAVEETEQPSAACGYVEHVHSDTCYTQNLICGVAEGTVQIACGKDVHVHAATCEHAHGDDCYVPNCANDGAIECGKDEHAHGDDCYVAHEHGDGCSDEEGNLICTEPEKTLACEAEHAHDDACKHVHGDGCYTINCENEGAIECGKEVHEHSEDCNVAHVHGEACSESVQICEAAEHTHDDTCYVVIIEEEPVAEPEDTSVVWDEENMTLALNGAALEEGITVPDGYTVIVNGDSSIAGGEGAAITGEGSLFIEGNGTLTLTGLFGIDATSVVIEGISVDFDTTSVGIYASNSNGDAFVILDNVDGSIVGDYAGIYVYGNTENSNAYVNMINDCDLEVISEATSWNNRARKSGVTVYASVAERVETSITISDSKVIATGYDAGLSINNYMNDADANNSASSKINITNSTVVAHGTNGTWAGIFASVVGKHADADSIITITDSSVYAVSPNTGILTSSQAGESKIILDNSVLGASGKTALSMIEETSQAQAAELINGSTYIQMTPDAVMNGEIVNFNGKTIIATAGAGITYNEDNNYYVIPQGSAVTENFTDGTAIEYTFENGAGGVGGFGYAKEEIWGYDVPEKWEEGDIIIYTPEELIEFATMTQDGTLGNCAGRNVLLGADIDMSGYDWYYRNAEGTIVTDHRIPDFDGHFDGQGYTISNMNYRDEYAAATEEVPLGMFIELDGTLENLTLDTVNVTSVAPTRFGALINDYSYQLEGSYVKNCDVKNVTIDQNDGKLVFGGMFWKILGSTEITDCHVENLYVDTEATLSGTNNGRCGGFFATGGEGGTVISDCSVKNFKVETCKVINYVGGFVGGTSGMTYKDCTVDGFTFVVEDLAKTHRTVAGFAAYTEGNGWNKPLVIENCHVKGLDLTLGAASTSTNLKGDAGFIGLFNNSTAGITIEDCSAAGSINVAGEILAGGFLAQSYKAPKNVAIIDCSTSVNVTSAAQAGGFVGEYAKVGGNAVTYTNCIATGDVFGVESAGSFLDADETNVDGIKGGTYNYDPENVDSATGETNNVAPGYRALDNGDGTWTVFPDNGKEVVKVAFHRWNDEQNAYENWRTVEVFKGVDFFEADYDNALNFSHPTYRFANGIAELDEEADDATERVFTYWTDAPDGTELVLDNEIEVLADMDVYAAYTDYVCMIVETGVKYTTLTAAVADANASEGADTIKMLKSIDFDSDKALSITGDVTIIGEGMTISRGAYTGTLFTVPAGSSLTLDGGITFDGSNNWIFNEELYNTNLNGLVSGTAWADYVTSEEGGTVAKKPMFLVNGSVTAKNTTIKNSFSTSSSNDGEYAIFRVNSGATLTTDGATITHVTANSASVVVGINGGTWNITGNTLITENYSGRNGGICRNNNGTINMSGGSVKDNYGYNTNGSFTMMYGKGSQLIMTGGEICHNSSVGGGQNGRCAAVYLHSNAYMKMTGGTICHNIGGARGGIDSYQTSSVLDINRVDQDFDNEAWQESGAAAYTASNHPLIVDNVSLSKSTQNDVGQSYNSDLYDWWVTGGIYTQDVDEFCAEGYICIPYEDSERTDDYIVVPGYRVKYFSVETVETTDETTGEVTSEIKETLVNKYFHMLPRDKFWYEMDERANTYNHIDPELGKIDTWYSEKELTNLYDFANNKLESDLNLYGEYAKLVVTYDYNGGIANELGKSQVTTEEKTYNPSLAGFPAPAKEGFDLIGWKYAVDSDPESTDMTDTGKWYMGETLTENTRLIAQWGNIGEEEKPDEPTIPVELGTKTSEVIDRNTNRFGITIDVPGADGENGHDEVILMVDGSYSLDQEWPLMKEAITTIGKTVLNGSGTTQLTLMAFGMGDNIVLEHVKDADALAAALGELPGTLLYGRSSTNCEAGFDGVANYIKNHDNTLNKVQVVYITDGNINTDETPRAFAQNWKTWTKFGALAVAQETLYGTLNNGKNLPAAITTVFGSKYGTTKDELLANIGSITEEEFLTFADQVWEDVYAYSGLHIGVAYPVSVAERAFVKYDKEMGTYIQDLFYYTTYKSAYVGYGNRYTRTPAAGEELAAMEEISALYMVDYDGYTAWMDTGITNEKASYISSGSLANLLPALENTLTEMAKSPFNNVVVTDYMSKWVNLDQDTIKIIDATTGKTIWDINTGWVEGAEKTTAKEPPVKVELVAASDYADGGNDVVGNSNGDIYKLTWYVKDGAMLRADNYQLSYEVTVDTEENGFVANTDYPANGTTEIEYDGGGNDIDVPDVDAESTIVNIQKVDENGDAMTGAEFEVFEVDENGNKTSIGTFAVDENGQYELALNPGDHLLVETKAPTGYLTAADPIEITVSDSLEVNVDETKAASYDNDTLTVVNRPPHAAVVLTIDMSGTMYRNKMSGTRYVEVAKAKALEFVDQYAASSEYNGKRMLAVTSFDTDAKVVQNWIDVSTASGLSAAKAAIKAMKVADNGSVSSNQVCTNFDAGVILSRNMLKQSAVSEVDRCFTVILSDGAPTVSVNSDTDTVGTIKSSFWGNQMDMNGTVYQKKHYGGGWTHPGEVDRTLQYLATGSNNLADLTCTYKDASGNDKEGIFIIGVGGLMSFKLFNDAVYGTSNGTRTSDVKNKPAAFNNVEALQGYTQAEIMELTTGDWMGILADKSGGTYVSATNASALASEFSAIMTAIKDTTAVS